MFAQTVGQLRGATRPNSVRFHGRLLCRFALLAGVGLFFSVFSLALCERAQSASINYGSHMGTAVTYVDVTEASATDPVPLYGAPTVAGNSIDFNPVLFNALSQFGGNPDLTDGQLTFMVVAKPGFAVQGINFAESGVTNVVGNGTNNTYTHVSAVGNVDIVEVDGVGIDEINVPINLLFMHTPPASSNPVGTWLLGTDGPALGVPWDGFQGISLTGVLDDHMVPYNFGVTKINVNLNNSLIAQSEEGTIAFIDKKDFGGLSITVMVPEPCSMFLSMAGLGLIGLVVRRRRRLS